LLVISDVTFYYLILLGSHTLLIFFSFSKIYLVKRFLSL